jgi:hypothetical protein
MWSAASHVHHLCYQAQETMQSDTALDAQADMRRSFPAVAHAQPSSTDRGVRREKRVKGPNGARHTRCGASGTSETGLALIALTRGLAGLARPSRMAVSSEIADEATQTAPLMSALCSFSRPSEHPPKGPAYRQECHRVCTALSCTRVLGRPYATSQHLV